MRCRTPRGQRGRHVRTEWQRKPGTTRGSPRRSRTAKASRISRLAVKSRCAGEWGGWGRLSEDGPGQHNPDPSEGPWGGGRPTLQGGASSGRRPGAVRDNRPDPEVHEGRRQTGRQQAYAGSRLKPLTSGKAPPDRPAFQPYWGKPAVRNERGDRGNVGIIRSPVRASILPDSVAQQKGLQMLALRAQVRHRGLTGPHQLAHGLMPRVGDPDQGEFASAMQPGQGDGIPAIGLDALARPLRDQRGSDDGAVVPEGGDLPLQPIAGWPGLVAEQQPTILAGELPDQPPHRLWRMVDVAQEAHLTLASLFRQGY